MIKKNQNQALIDNKDNQTERSQKEVKNLKKNIKNQKQQLFSQQQQRQNKQLFEKKQWTKSLPFQELSIENYSKIKIINQSEEKQEQIDQIFLSIFSKEIRQLLKGVKRISITPNTKTSSFQKKGWLFPQAELKTHPQNQNICIGSGMIFSNQSLPINYQQQSFYYAFKAINISGDYYGDGRNIQFGIAFSQSLQDMNNINKLNQYQYSPKNAASYISYGSYCIVYVNKKDRLVYIIWDNKVYHKQSLQKIILTRVAQKGMKLSDNKLKCYAYIRVYFGRSIVQLT